jgi:hypothetical protein
MTRKRDRRKHVCKATKYRIDIVIRYRTDIAINNSNRNSIGPLVNFRVRTNLNIKLRVLRTIYNLNSLSSNNLNSNSSKPLNISKHSSSDLNFLSSNSLNSSKSHKTLSNSSVNLLVTDYLSHIQTYLMQRFQPTYLLIVRDIRIGVLVCFVPAVVHLATKALCALFLKLNDYHNRRTNTW